MTDEQRLSSAKQMFWDNVVVDSEKRGGIPLIKGTRFSVGELIAELAERPVSEIAANFEVDRDVLNDIVNAISICFDVHNPGLVELFELTPTKEIEVIGYTTVLVDLTEAYLGFCSRYGSKERLEEACRTASQWIEHGKMSTEEREELLDLLRVAEARLI